jgi:hypothetical protein
MDILEFIFRTVEAMAVIYVIFNFKDFIKSWASWILFLLKGIWNGIKWIGRKIRNIFKRK